MAGTRARWSPKARSAPSGNGRGRKPRSRSATPSGTSSSILDADNPATSPNSAQQVDVLIGDQSLGTAPLEKGAPGVVRKIPITRRAAGDGGHGRDPAGRGQDVRAGARARRREQRHARARRARVPRLRADRQPPCASWRTLGVSLLGFLAMPAAAAADILVFHTGRTMSVANVRPDGDRLLLTLRDGGEASVPDVLIARDRCPTRSPRRSPNPRRLPCRSRPLSAGRRPGRSWRARPFAALIASAAATHGVDVRLVHAVIEAESNYQPRARSRTGAQGLMQLMPATARRVRCREPLRSPQANLEAGVRHLKYLLSRFDLRLALAAYNAGDGAVPTMAACHPSRKRAVT